MKKLNNIIMSLFLFSVFYIYPKKSISYLINRENKKNSPSTHKTQHAKNNLIWHDFYKSTFVASQERIKSSLNNTYLGTTGDNVLKFFNKLYYESKSSKKATKQVKYKIHQIWIGPKPFPEEFKKYKKSWIDKHPNWEYKLWNDKDIEEFKLRNKELYDKSTNYAEKADIARYEILYREGGVYVDVDIKCLKPIDKIHKKFDFYAGMNAVIDNPEEYIYATNALIGATAKHPILKYCIKTLNKAQSLPEPFGKLIAIVSKTGPGHLTRACLKLAGKTNRRDIVFPSIYFYPAEKEYNPKSYCIHYWANSAVK